MVGHLSLFLSLALKKEIRKRFLSEKISRTKSETTPELITHPSRVLSNHNDVFVHNPLRNFVSGNLQI